MDAFDCFWQWADKPLDDPSTVPADLHWAVMQLDPYDRRDRAKVNEAAARRGQNPGKPPDVDRAPLARERRDREHGDVRGS